MKRWNELAAGVVWLLMIGWWWAQLDSAAWPKAQLTWLGEQAQARFRAWQSVAKARAEIRDLPEVES